jgi:hypothetical protein
MSEISTFTSQSNSMHGFIYGHGQSSLGGFLTAIDEKGVCAILLSDDRTELLRDLPAVFPDRKLDSAPSESIVTAVASLIEQPPCLALSQRQYAAAISSRWSMPR